MRSARKSVERAAEKARGRLGKMPDAGRKGKIRERLARLYPTDEIGEVADAFWRQRGKELVALLAIFLLLAAAVNVFGKEPDVLEGGRRIGRPGVDEAEKEVRFSASIEGGGEAEEITLEVGPRQYAQEEFESLVEGGSEAVLDALLGENASAEEVTESLSPPKSLSGTPISISWESDKEDVVGRDGTLNADLAEKGGTVVTMTANFSYEDWKMSQAYPLRVLPPALTDAERIRKELREAMDGALADTVHEESVPLPLEVEGKEVRYEERRESRAWLYAVALVLGIAFWAAILEQGLADKEKERDRQLLIEYPEMISRFTLLIGAGMTISGAWRRLVEQYEKRASSGRREYVYEEMTVTCREMQNGVPEVEAIERFGSRVRLPQYLKFSSLLSQNLRKGSKELSALLKADGKMAYEERRERAKQLGEEASTKLLLPMMMMLVIVFVIILVPSFMSF